MTDKLNSVIIGEIVAKDMQDETLKQSLLANPEKVLAEGGVTTTGIHYSVVEDTATLKNIILPSQPLTKTMQLDTLPDGASPALVTRYIITRAQADEDYRKQVLGDINSVLQDLGVSLPTGITLNIVANDDKLQHIVIPYVPPASGELSDEQLASVAGGKHHSKGKVTTHTNVAANAEAAINAVAVTEGAAVADVAAAAQVAAAAEAAAVAVAVVVLT